MRTFILLTISTLFLFGCAVQTQQTQLPTVEIIFPTPNVIDTASPIPLPSSTNVNTEVPLTDTSIETITFLPNQTFHFGATPQMSQVGGISGVFYHEGEPDENCAQTYSVFRFYDDGLVIDVSVCDDESTGDFSKGIWSYISEWFSRENIAATASQGIYHRVEDKIWFTTVAEYPSHTVVSDYLGTISEDQLILDRFTYPNGYQIKEREGREEYIWFDIPENP